MNQLVQNPVFQAYAASAVVLGLNLLVLANNTALTRAKSSEVINPEDKAKLNPKADVVYDDGNDKTARYRRAHRNALENVPLFLITGFLLALTSVPAMAAYILFGIFVVTRVLHSVFYVGAVQPWRTAMFGIAALDQLAILGFFGYYVFAA